MPLQDLTPQLRTRLNKVERGVGWFVFVATILLVCGFGYYIYHTAERKGWFKIKAPFFIFVQSSTGLNIGDPVVMMGFPVGEITGIEPMPPGDKRNVRVDFVIRADYRRDYFRYIWRDGSYVKVNAADFLGKRQLEVTRGTNGPAIVVTQPGQWRTISDLESFITSTNDQWQLYQDVFDGDSNLLFQAYTTLTPANLSEMAKLNFNSNSIFVYDNKVNFNRIVAAWDNRVHRYENFSASREAAYLRAVEPQPISDQLQAMVAQVQVALPNILQVTNKLFTVLDRAAEATSNLNITVKAAQPLITNFTLISEQLRAPGGLSLWALGTNGDGQIQMALTNVNQLIVGANTNLDELSREIGLTLENVAGITSNLNLQVQANSNLLWGISKTVMDSDDFVQGLKRHWLLRSAFKTKPTNSPPTKAR